MHKIFSAAIDNIIIFCMWMRLLVSLCMRGVLFSHRQPLSSPFLSLSKLSVMMNQNDEFGDDSFLAGFDVDAAILERRGGLESVSPFKRAKRSPIDTIPRTMEIKSSDEAQINPGKDVAGPILSADGDMITLKPLLTKALEQTLQKYFGYASFRSQQLEVIQAILDQRDVGVFWATGSGKSLCYQIPALHTGHIGIVVSPLISLMEDQAHKLNTLSTKTLATFLGSGQTDNSMEDRALNGEFPLVYVTPEKLLSGNFMQRLETLHREKKRLSVIAIDESHCVSEWGHDFRPEYRQLHLIRETFTDVPIVALTATAVSRVQNDILTNLRLNNPFIAKQSFDRTNLAISIVKKRSGGVSGNLSPLLSKLRDKASTIIYAPTRNDVEDICSYLQQKLPELQVEAYHAGMTSEHRTLAHTNFLVSKTNVICATVAFGMGIDKPDTRRVLHYGPPKTMEEYYQQVGRAGRDGLPAECMLIVADNDFDRYKSDFYMGNLPVDARHAMTHSLDALRNYALDCQTCRRKSLLSFFEEHPSFGDYCGTCDVCQTRKDFGDDLERDMSKMGARIVLAAVLATNEQGLSVLDKVIGGNIVESYRYKGSGGNIDPNAVKKFIEDERGAMERKRPLSYFRELFAPLVTKGYLAQKSKTVQVPGQAFTRSVTYYDVTTKGANALHDRNIPIILPVPQSIRDIEKDEAEKVQKKLALLEKSGVNLNQIPKDELETGEGEVIQSFSKWHSYTDSLARSDRHDRLQQLEDLRLRIDAWRLDSAAMNRVAPASVLAEHIVFRIAYTVASMKPGAKVERDALIAAGVRSRQIDSLVQTLHEWVDEVQPALESKSASYQAMVFDNEPFVPSKQWEHAIYKPQKKTGLATWESSHHRFLAGESPQAISMTPVNGRPIQVRTVVDHILQGLELGRPTPLRRLAHAIAPPNKKEWDQLEGATLITGMSVAGDPNTSGLNGEKFLMTEFLRPILGDTICDLPFKERSPAQSNEFGKWCELLKWYMTLKRVQYRPRFDE